MVSRVERGPVADWMRTADRWLIGSFIALMVIGVVMALAASPAVAERLNLSTFHFVNRQALMLMPTAALMIATSFLLAPPCAARGAGDVRGLVHADHSRAHVRRGGERGEALDLRPSAIGVHQAGLRRACRLGFHGRGPHRPDRDLGETSVLPAPADRHCAAHPRARLRADDAGRGRVDGALLPRRPALVLGGRGRGHGNGRRLRGLQAVAARA